MAYCGCEGRDLNSPSGRSPASYIARDPTHLQRNALAVRLESAREEHVNGKVTPRLAEGRPGARCERLERFDVAGPDHFSGFWSAQDGLRAQSAAPGRRHPGGPIEQTVQLPNPRSRGGRVGRGCWGEPSLGESLRIGLHFLRICGGGGLLLPHERVELASRERRRHGRCFEWPWLIRLGLGKVMVRGVHGAHDAGGAIAGPVVSAFSCHYRNRPFRLLV
jgi:hypothetical protein